MTLHTKREEKSTISLRRLCIWGYMNFQRYDISPVWYSQRGKEVAAKWPTSWTYTISNFWVRCCNCLIFIRWFLFINRDYVFCDLMDVHSRFCPTCGQNVILWVCGWTVLMVACLLLRKVKFFIYDLTLNEATEICRGKIAAYLHIKVLRNEEIKSQRNKRI